MTILVIKNNLTHRKICSVQVKSGSTPPPPFPSRSKLKPEYEIPSDAPWFQYNNAIKAILLLIQLYLRVCLNSGDDLKSIM